MTSPASGVTVRNETTRSDRDDGAVRRHRPAFSPLRGDAVRSALPLVLAIALVSAYTGSRTSTFLTWDNAQNILLQGSVLALIAVGQTFLIAAGQLDLSVGSLAAFTAVVSATMLRDGSSEPLVILTCLAIGAIVGLVWGMAVAYLRIPPFILTLGGLSVLRSLAMQRADDTPVPARGHLQWLNAYEVFGVLRVPVFLALVTVVLAALVLRYTRFGRQVYALGSSEEAAYLAGIPTNRIKIACFVLSSTLVALAGVVLMARIGAGDPRSAGGWELQAIAAVVLGGGVLAGGRGTPVGTYLGVVLLGVVGASLTFLNVDASLNDLVFGGVLIFAVTAAALGERRRERQGTSRLRLANLAGLVRRGAPDRTDEHPTGPPGLDDKERARD